MRRTRALLRVSKGIYDILATYLLGWILLFASIAAAFALIGKLGADLAFVVWLASLLPRISYWFSIDVLWLRVVVFGLLHVAIIWALRAQIGVLQRLLEACFDKINWAIDRTIGRWAWPKFALGVLFTLVVTVMLVPFVVQPTLVAGFGKQSFLERSANLLDGTASLALCDSVVGFYRRLVAEPVIEDSLSPDEANDIQTWLEDPDAVDGPLVPFVPPITTGRQPMMDRWDPHIWAETGDDPRKFAMVKAFMWVESGGQQFAVSTTGCSGLMQFCAGTARGNPYRNVFGTGQIYVCKCEGQCRIGAETRRSLESGRLEQISSRSAAFPCELTDARFNAIKSIRAGKLYVDRLDEAYGGNLFLMYIGYNSGPAVANAVYNKLGRNAAATLDEINTHLADAMRPHYGAGSQARANSLVRTHLPKIEKAYLGYAQPLNI
ncbi:MAG: lytic transglycosylase domain-containing protein [Bradymonadaceae bacterium]|nr:lytic transglycosylase domain-containing protein [Lujinxingiaceae bacterium]